VVLYLNDLKIAQLGPMVTEFEFGCWVNLKSRTGIPSVSNVKDAQETKGCSARISR
jgi:hypothetical protein